MMRSNCSTVKPLNWTTSTSRKIWWLHSTVVDIVLLYIYILIAIKAFVSSNHHDKLTISPSNPEAIHYVNESHIVTCIGSKDMAIEWLNPKGKSVSDKKGRVHVEAMASGHLALVFEHIALSDKGEWTCRAKDGEAKKSFKMLTNQQITFLDTPVVQTYEEGSEATVRCEVKGDPEPQVSWSFNGQSIVLPHAKFTKLADGLLIKKVSRNDSGEYTCRAYQVSETISNVREKTIRLNVQHKPIAPPRKASADIQYGYMNGVVNLTCEAEAEPHATFSWSRDGKKISPKNHPIYQGNHTSMLRITINDVSAFGKYNCKAANSMGILERVITLKEGTKPDTPSQFSLRGVNSDTFDIDVGAVRTSNVRTPMDINGYRFEVVPEQEYRANGEKWDNARILSFGFEDGVTFLINNLQSNTTYAVRVASRNSAGLSDWTETKFFATYPKEPIMNAAPATTKFVDSKFLSSSRTIIAVFVLYLGNYRKSVANQWFETFL